METVTCRLLPFSSGNGPENMAADEVLLESARAGLCSLRFYTWTEPTLSLGYFQPSSSRLKDPELASLPFVRRPTGGAILVHHRELTYALGLPGLLVSPKNEPWLVRIHRIIAGTLNSLGISCRLALGNEINPPSANLCFQKYTPGDVLCGGAKIAGSAQRKQRGCLLQHGALLLAVSSWTRTLPGIHELSGQNLNAEQAMEGIIREFRKDTGFDLVPCPWTLDERRLWIDRSEKKYSQPSWNEKR